jgi:hypothetical protein
MTGQWDDSAMRAAINARVDQMLADAKLGVQDAMEYVLGESAKIVPIEEGSLQDSGRTAVKVDGDQIIGAFGYGTGAAAAYAIPQHERTDYAHDNGRQAKYAEVPLVAAGMDGTLLGIVKRRVR